MARAAPKSKKRPAPKSKKEEPKEDEVLDSGAEDKEEENNKGNDVSDQEDHENNVDEEEGPPKKKGRGRPSAGKKGAKKGAAAKKTASGSTSRGRKSTKKEESEEEDDDKEYEVEKVVDVRTKAGKTEYRIKWKRYAAHHNTWEPEEHLNCEEAIKAFEAKQEKLKNTPTKTLRAERKTTDRYVDVAGPGNANKLRHSRRGGKGGAVRKSYREDPDSD